MLEVGEANTRTLQEVLFDRYLAFWPIEESISCGRGSDTPNGPPPLTPKVGGSNLHAPNQFLWYGGHRTMAVTIEGIQCLLHLSGNDESRHTDVPAEDKIQSKRS